MSVIVYGPQGCGKTTRAKQIARHFGLSRIIDDGVDESGNPWEPGDPIPEDTLVLTSIPTAGAVDFDEVVAAIGPSV